MPSPRDQLSPPSPAVLSAQPAALRAHAGDAARLLRALANEHRLLVLCALAEGERSVSELNAQVALSQPALSQHLALLREEALVQTRRAGQTIYYRLAEGAAREVLQALHRAYCELPGDH